MVGPRGLPGESDLFFENLGSGRFRDATAAAGLTDGGAAYGFGVVATDYDGDGRVDLFVANDSNPNFLYRNVTAAGGAPRFESVGLIAGVAVNGEARAQAGMGADAGDYDGDGRIDLALTAFAHDRNTIYRNVDGGSFEDATAAAGLATATFTRMGWGTAFVDADLDGRLDLARGQRPHLRGRRPLPRPRRDLRPGQPAAAQPGRRPVPRRVGRHGPRPADAARQPRPGRRRSRRRRRPRRRAQQHGRAAGAARESPADRSSLDRLPPGRARPATALRSAPRSRSRAAASVRCARSAPAAAICRSRICARCSGWASSAGPVSVEVRMPGGARWWWQDLPVDRLHVLELTGAGRR